MFNRCVCTHGGVWILLFWAQGKLFHFHLQRFLMQNIKLPLVNGFFSGVDTNGLVVISKIMPSEQIQHGDFESFSCRGRDQVGSGILTWLGLHPSHLTSYPLMSDFWPSGNDNKIFFCWNSYHSCNRQHNNKLWWNRDFGSTTWHST